MTKREAQRFARRLEREGWRDVSITLYVIDHRRGWRVDGTDSASGYRKHWDAVPE